MALDDRFLLKLGPGKRRLVDPADIYFLQAEDEDSRVQHRSSQTMRDLRPLAELERSLIPRGFFRAHCYYLVNLRRVREIRRRSDGDDWELKLEPPVNRVLPISFLR